MTQSRLLRCHDCRLITFHEPIDGGWRCAGCGVISETVQGSLVTVGRGGSRDASANRHVED